MTLEIDTQLIMALAALIAGIVILVAPRVLNYVVAIYLILIGLVGLLRELGVVG
jgi:hypothetical protein